MHARLIAVTAAALSLSTPANAADSWNLAKNLGLVIVSEKVCNLTYDPKAIELFIQNNVDAADMEFARNLQNIITLEGYRINDLTSSSKVAHCTQIERVARANGFIE